MATINAPASTEARRLANAAWDRADAVARPALDALDALDSDTPAKAALVEAAREAELAAVRLEGKAEALEAAAAAGGMTAPAVTFGPFESTAHGRGVAVIVDGERVGSITKATGADGWTAGEFLALRHGAGFLDAPRGLGSAKIACKRAEARLYGERLADAEAALADALADVPAEEGKAQRRLLARLRQEIAKHSPEASA